MSRHPDPIVRRCLVYDRAQARTKRRVAALLSYLYAEPMGPQRRRSRYPDAALRRLDDLLGEADKLRRAL